VKVAAGICVDEREDWKPGEVEVESTETGEVYLMIHLDGDMVASVELDLYTIGALVGALEAGAGR
jgi:hypothetical protein